MMEKLGLWLQTITYDVVKTLFLELENLPQFSGIQFSIPLAAENQPETKAVTRFEPKRTKTWLETIVPKSRDLIRESNTWKMLQKVRCSYWTLKTPY